MWTFLLGSGPTRWLHMLDPVSGTIEVERPSYAEVQLPTGEFVVVGADTDLFGPLTVWNPADGSDFLIQNCVTTTAEFWPDDDILGYVCPDGELFYGVAVSATTDGRFIAGLAYDPTQLDVDPQTQAHVRIWDASTWEIERTIEVKATLTFATNEPIAHFGDGWLLMIDGRPGTNTNVVYSVYDSTTGELIASLDGEGIWRESHVVSSDGTALYAVEESGHVWIYDTTSWESTADWRAQKGRPRGIALSPDESLLAVSGEDGFVVIWDLAAREIVDLIPAPTPSDIMWIDDRRMAVAIFHGIGETEWRVIDLDPAAVVEAARTALVRGFAPEECDFYRIDPCPTLAEIRGR